MSTRQCHVTLVSERGDDKARPITHVLVSISEPCVCLANEAVQIMVAQLITIVFKELLPVVSKLLLPVERVDVLDSVLDQKVCHHILGMDI